MMLEDLKSGVDDPRSGLELVTAFYQADSYVFEQCDDSGGDVGDVFVFDAKELFVEYASKFKDKQFRYIGFFRIPYYRVTDHEDVWGSDFSNCLHFYRNCFSWKNQ